MTAPLLRYPELSTALLGRWLLCREVTAMPPITGTCEFTETAHGILHSERVTYTLPGVGSMSGYRHYLWRFTNQTAVQIVHATPAGTPGEPFLRFKFSPVNGALTAHDRHLCGADRYDGTFVFENEDTLRIRYVVNGPRKHYVMTSRMTRVQM